MTQAMNTKLRFTAIAGALALAATLFTAPAAIAGERGDRWDRDRSPRVERHYDRDRKVQRHRRVHRRADRRSDRRAVRRAYRDHDRRAYSPHGHRHGHRHGRHYGHRHDHSLAPVVAGIGLGILTYAIIDSHRRY